MKLAKGDRVRLTDDCAQLHFPETPRKGETGRLDKLYRVQDGLEIWRMILDRPGYVFIAVPHTKLEKLEDGK